MRTTWRHTMRDSYWFKLFDQTIIEARCPLWVKSGNAPNEPMMSAFHPIATEQRTQFYVRSVPLATLVRQRNA